MREAIDRAQEAGLIARAKQGDRAAQSALLQLHAGAIYACARRYLRATLDLEDLAQEVRLGFLDGIRSYDPVHGTALLGWCLYYGRRAAQTHLRRQGYPMSVPHGAWREALRSGATSAWAWAPVSLDAPGADGGEALAERLPAGGGPDEAALDLDAAIDGLTSPQDRDVIRRRLAGESLSSIGATWTPPVGRERIRQIEARAIGRVRRALGARGVRA